MHEFPPSYLAHRPLSILPLQFPHVADVLHLISDHRCSALKLDRLDEYVEKVSMYNCSSADREQSGQYCREQRSETRLICLVTLVPWLQRGKECSTKDHLASLT